MKVVRLYRVKMNSLGLLPKGFPEGMLTGMTSDEFKQIQNIPHIRECFEEVHLDQGCINGETHGPTEPTGTATV